jgi:cytochrome c oxidase subunit II
MMARLAAVLLLLAAAACAGNQSALDPAGPQAQSIASLMSWFFAVCAAVYVVVTGALLWALVRRRRAAGQLPERPLVIAVGTSVAVTAIVVIGLTIVSVAAGRGLESAPDDTSLDVDVIGQQWWWEFQYTDDEHPDRLVVSPNELHLPVGARVRIHARTRDVIHSFWVPNLRGKRDLIPGRDSETWIQADRPGLYRGQCAEFCGEQHAKMAFLVVSESMDTFQRWLSAQRATAADPATELTRRGRDVFMGGPCVMCHTIRGTEAGARNAPDLTHVASRRFIAAGTLPNTADNLARWILDAHAIKPGTLMPPNPLNENDLRAIVAYIGTLK